MKRVQVLNEKREVIARNVLVADTFFTKLKGIMFSKDMSPYDGLIIGPHCNSIHTFFCFFPIDVMFLNKKEEVVKIIRNLHPWRMTRMYFRASHVLEMVAGTLPETIKEGDKLEVLCIS